MLLVFFSGSKIFTREGVFHCLTCTALKQKYYLLVLQNFRWVNNSCHPVMFLLLANICCDPNFESGVLATAQCVIFFFFWLFEFFIYLISLTRPLRRNSTCHQKWNSKFYLQCYHIDFYVLFLVMILWNQKIVFKLSQL